VRDKSVPVDREPSAEGNILLTKNTVTGRVSGIYQQVGSDPKLRQSHFKTCPDAGKWSKKGKTEAPDGQG
jgi:hypothetical protein